MAERLVITDKGNGLAAKLLAGTTTAVFTKIATSDFDYSDCDLKKLEELAVKQETLISRVEREDAVVTVYGSIDAGELAEGYYIRAVGLYAADAEGTEILYAVATDEFPKYLEPYKDGSRIMSGATFKLHVKVDNASQVSMEVNPAAVPSLAQVQDMQKKVETLETELSSINQTVINMKNTYVQGEGLTLFVDDDGILNIIYDDGTEEGEEETGNEADNQSS